MIFLSDEGGPSLAWALALGVGACGTGTSLELTPSADAGPSDSTLDASNERSSMLPVRDATSADSSAIDASLDASTSCVFPAPDLLPQPWGTQCGVERRSSLPTDTCRDDEYVVECQLGLGLRPASEIGPGCRGVEGSPGGGSYCCPCSSDSHDTAAGGDAESRP